MEPNVRWVTTTFFGLLVLPASAGLSISLYDFLIGVHSDALSLRELTFFLSGFGLWILVFVFLNRPVRLYILGHELTHLLVAWASGIRGGEMEIGSDGGSVRVERSTFWIAIAPYVIPLYSLLVILGFGFLPSQADSVLVQRLFPILLGLTWSFHITFTLYAVCQPQSDFHSYGLLGSLSIILLLNLLLLTFLAAMLHSDPFTEEVSHAWERVQGCYAWTWTQLLLIKNTIIQG